MNDQTEGISAAVKALMAATADLSKAVTKGVGDKVSGQIAAALESAADSVEAAARSVSPQKSNSTRNQIIEAAAEVFAEKGFASATLDEVAKRAGRTKGSIYAHFSSKDDLMMALITQDEGGEPRERDTDAVLAAYGAGTLPALIDEPLQGSNSLSQALLSVEILAYALRVPTARQRVGESILRQKEELEADIRKRFPDAIPDAALALACIVNLGGLYAAVDLDISSGEKIYELLKPVLGTPTEDY